MSFGAGGLGSPNMPRIIDPDTHFAVERDGLPRVAAYDDGSRHVLYLDGATVRSMSDADWPPPLPAEPTAEQIAAAIAAREAARQQAAQDALALRQRVIMLAQSAVGVQIDALTAAQVRALIALLLWQAGAIDRAGMVKPLGEWVRGT